MRSSRAGLGVRALRLDAAAGLHRRRRLIRALSGLVGVGGGPRLAVDAEPELLPHLEERHPLGVHGDQRARLGIPPLARLAVLHDEAAEAADLDPLAARERLAHAVEDRVDHHLGVAAREAREELQHLDRKSTRLNSSHPSISYAVFCL